MSKLFIKKENRDEAWEKIPKQERVKYKRSSVRNQLLHPMYVEDYEKVTGHKLTPEDRGFGNTLYRTHFAILYEITEMLVRM